METHEEKGECGMFVLPQTVGKRRESRLLKRYFPFAFCDLRSLHESRYLLYLKVAKQWGNFLRDLPLLGEQKIWCIFYQ